jgi:hypothetical protein
VTEESRPETPEETLARLSAYARSVDLETPSPYQAVEGTQDRESVEAAPPTPYQPAPGQAAQPTHAAPGQRVPTQPTPHQPAAPPPALPAPVRRTRTGLIVGLVVGALVLIIVAVGAVSAVRWIGAERPIAEPVPSSPADAADGAWINYPGTAYLDDPAVLAGPRLEQVQSESARLAEEYRAALTDQFGLTWTEVYEPLTGHDENGYGGTSLLYYYSSEEWQGSAKVSDPQARQKIRDLFTRIAGEYGSTETRLSNELSVDDAESAKRRFGAATQADQPMWSLRAEEAIGDFVAVRSEVLDRSFPIDPSWEGDIWFDLEQAGKDDLVVTLRVDAYGLLSEKDEVEYRDRLDDYDLDAKPEGEG